MFGYGVMFTALAITWLPITHLSIRRAILVVGLWAHVDGVDTATPQGQAVQCGLPVSLGFYTLYFCNCLEELACCKSTHEGWCMLVVFV